MSDEPLTSAPEGKPILDAIVFDQRKPPPDGKKRTIESSVDDPKVLRWLLGYLGKHRSLTALVYVMVVVSAVMGFAILPFTKLLMDSVQNLTASQTDFEAVLGASFLGRFFVGFEAIHVIELSALLLVGIKLVHVLLGFVNNYANDVLIGKVTRDIRADLFDQLISMRDDYYHEHNVGEMMARFTQDLNGAVSIYTTVFFSPIIEVTTLAISGVYLVLLNPILGGIALLFAPVYYFVVGPLGKAIESKVGGVSAQFAAVNEDLQETLSAVKEIKAHGSESRERVEFGRNLDNHYRATLDYSRWQLIAGQAIKFISEAAPVIILVIGALLIVHDPHGNVTLGTLIVVFGSVAGVLGSMSSLSNVKIAYRNGLTFARQVWRILQEPREERVLSGKDELRIPSPIDPKTPVIEFDHVYMTYPRSGYQVSDLTFKVYPGQTVAIIGEGGSGKSTVFNLLFKFYNYERGSVKLFGQELRSLSVASVRRAIGYMTQFPFFFQRSFQENLLYGIDARDTAAIDRMKALCAEFGMDEVINSMPEGYDSQITNRGANLSGSQQKRTALVRALMKDPPFLLLDEPLSGLSPEQRLEVNRRVGQLAGRKTIFTITHDLDLIKDMDLILVFKREDRQPDMEILSEEEAALLAEGALPEGALPKGMLADGPLSDGAPRGDQTPLPKGALPEGPLPKGALPEGPLPKGALPKGDAPLPKGGNGKGPPPREVQQHGVIAEQGSYAQLSQTGVIFRRLIAQEAPAK